VEISPAFFHLLIQFVGGNSNIKSEKEIWSEEKRRKKEENEKIKNRKRKGMEKW
jgi:hypothetical protein